MCSWTTQKSTRASRIIKQPLLAGSFQKPCEKPTEKKPRIRDFSFLKVGETFSVYLESDLSLIWMSELDLGLVLGTESISRKRLNFCYCRISWDMRWGLVFGSSESCVKFGAAYDK
ncbi:hypothetical protein E3N88_44312 [Mikania micrantha]|uniref:Uncharacterized protein n=1 Tax=Mikania micrantha TaxID=192012 RepID=A0A5N6LCM2_9ASTR|nr:hypothetical protein E3N88_44312 [Mikania micrantha]